MALTKFNYNSFDVTPVASKALAFNSGANGLTTAAEGSMVLIKTVTASSDSTISFVDGTDDVVLDNTYPIYVFKFISVAGNPGDQLLFNGSDDDSSHAYDITKTTTFFQAYNNEAGTSSGVSYSASRDLAQATGFQDLIGTLGNDADESCSGELWLFNPSSTTFVTHFFSRITDTNAGAQDENVAGYFNTTADITAVQFKMDDGNIDSGTIKLYGIKDS